MSRPTAILAVADGKAAQVINNIPGLEYVSPDGQRFQHPRLNYERAGVVIELIVQRVANNVTLPWTSAATSGKWDVYLLTADPGACGREAVKDDGGWRWLTRAFRRLRQLSADHPTYMRGPWSLAHLLEAYPAKAAELLKTEVLDAEGNPTGELAWSFPLLAGDTPAGLLAVDYRPTQEDIDGDIDADPATLFGGAP